MTKKDFLNRLRAALSGLNWQERAKSLDYYSELIADKIEDGMSEEDAVAECGDIWQIAEQIIADAKANGTVKKRISPVLVVLLILGSPLWFSLAVALFSVVFALYVCVWAVIISMFAVIFALFAGGLAGIFGFALTAAGSPMSALFIVGCGLICASAGLFFMIPVVKLSVLLVKSTGGLFVRLYNKIFKKEHAVR